MGKLFFAIIAAVAVILGIITFSNQQKPSQPVLTNLFDSPTPTPLAFHLNSKDPNSSSLPQRIATPESTPSIGPADPKPTENQAATISAIIQTAKGNIVVTLYRQAAPNTVANFISKVQSGFYDGLDFHRVEDWVVQGGDPNGNGTGGKNNMAIESNELSFVRGSLGMAGSSLPNGSTVGNDSQFFILKSDASWLNKQYTNFGIVTSGMDVVDKIQIGDKILGIKILN
ncbi:MAG TPA: peptidylprolyl isomerase [Patescibacteria group bacterium]